MLEQSAASWDPLRARAWKGTELQAAGQLQAALPASRLPTCRCCVPPLAQQLQEIVGRGAAGLVPSSVANGAAGGLGQPPGPGPQRAGKRSMPRCPSRPAHPSGGLCRDAGCHGVC